LGAAAVVFRFGLAVVFLLSGLAKLPRRTEFTRAVRNYRLVPERVGSIVAKVLPPVELAAGLLLALGFGVSTVAALLGLFLVVFAGAAATNLLRGRIVDCGCFGPVAERRITWWTVARNLVLAGAAAVVVATGPTALALDRLLPGAASPTMTTDAALALMFAATLAVVTTSLAQDWRRVARLLRAAEERRAPS
jgi:uncharacterized membrane protein YphA (DoxX/SURF4 family)